MKRSKCPATFGFNSEATVHFIYCGKWSCPRCAKKNASRWAQRAKQGLEVFAEDLNADAWFLTLTLGQTFTSAYQGFLALPKLWDSTRKAYQRYYGTFTYMAFVEGQANRKGMPHFHILTLQEPPTRRGHRGYVTQRGTHDFARAMGWGFEAKLELVTSDQAAIYITKYASKGDPAMPRNFRRVRVSGDWPKLPDLAGSPLLVPARSEELAHYISRVVDFTKVDAEIIYQLYFNACQELQRDL